MENLGKHNTRSTPKPTKSRLGKYRRHLRVPGDVWKPAILVVLILLFWEIAARMGAFSPIFFPAPSRIAEAMLQLGSNGILFDAVIITMARWFTGLLIGGFLGLCFGMLLGWLPPLQPFTKPFIAAFHPMPKIAILPLIMVIFGIGETSKIIVIMTAAFFPVLLNTLTGIEQIHPAYFDLAHNYGAGRLRMLWRVLIPASLPAILTGFLIAANLALLVTISVEIVSAGQGLGAMIWLSWEIMHTVDLYVALSMIVVLGILIYGTFYFLRRVLISW
jgi:NitT/TauT family transport system permease protein